MRDDSKVGGSWQSYLRHDDQSNFRCQISTSKDSFSKRQDEEESSKIALYCRDCVLMVVGIISLDLDLVRSTGV